MSDAADADVDLDAVARAATSCPSVAKLSSGVMGEIATYLPGRRVNGVRVVEGAVEIHTVARWAPSLPAVADEVRGAVAPLVGSRPVMVFIDDIVTEDELAAERAQAAPATPPALDAPVPARPGTGPTTVPFQP